MYRVTPFAGTFDPALVSGYMTITVMQSVEIGVSDLPCEFRRSPPTGAQKVRAMRNSMDEPQVFSEAEMLTVKDVGKLLKVSERTIRNLVADPDEKFPGPRRFGRNTRWLACEIIAWQRSTR